MMNFILILIIIIGASTAIYMLWFRNNLNETEHKLTQHMYNFDAIQQFIRDAMHELIASDLYEGNPNMEEFQRRKARRNELRKSLRSCMNGDISAKRYVKLYMKDLLQNTYKLGEDNIHLLIPFHRSNDLSAQDCFDILLYVYKKEHGEEGLQQLIEKYHLDQEKKYDDGSVGYHIHASEIIQIYELEQPRLTFDEKLDIVVQRVYQKYKGLGVIDEIRDQNIDGVNGGTSGLPSDMKQNLDLHHYTEQTRMLPQAHDAVWIFYKGKSLHLSFLSFASELELKRVCQNIYTFGSPGQLNESKSYIVNDMADGSRVVVVRPKMSESWAFFVRKFNTQLMTLPDLIKGTHAELPIKMLEYLIKGEQVTIITGSQGSGKTVTLLALMRYINRAYNIRIQEMAFELRARKIYADRNILSMRETPTVSGQEGLDIQKKTDGAVNILGEVASHPVASYMIQMATVASLFTLCTHHAKTFPNLVSSLRNSLLQAGGFSNETIAEKQVVEVLNFNVHLVKSPTGQRYIDRITECIPMEETQQYGMDYKGETKFERKVTAFMDNVAEYFYRQTDRKTYQHQDIIIWEDGAYAAKHRPSNMTINNMASKMSPDDAAAFQRFIEQKWGRSS
ncbi:ATPase, T2SS/T4P/T4SS family [Longirhabdus pacifica]|uniref:ATPase, T2SS/T4P/T4SS family n=1 Tax=Longirhabdus pacifica TaxID=2305227 RepID=UPI0019814828|nr:ATPase, T2SS/T4P/T4SS family [Longirhabdus pacifica]